MQLTTMQSSKKWVRNQDKVGKKYNLSPYDRQNFLPVIVRDVEGSGESKEVVECEGCEDVSKGTSAEKENVEATRLKLEAGTVTPTILAEAQSKLAKANSPAATSISRFRPLMESLLTEFNLTRKC